MGNVDSQSDSVSEVESSVDMDNNQWQEVADNMDRDNTDEAIRELEESKCILSKEDFENYFEGEDFQQRNIGDCRLLAVIDSLVSFGDYERLIRENVIKDNKGYTFYLPLGAPHFNTYRYFVSYDELDANQMEISGEVATLVTGKQGIQALVLAYGKKCTGKYGQFDYNNLNGGRPDYALNDLVFGMKTYRKSRIPYPEIYDPLGQKDSKFIGKFYEVLENFDRKYDMLILNVNQLQESDLDRQNIEGEAYSSLGHYSNSNHAISVEKVRKENGTLMITLSNPRDSNRTYDIAFDNLIKSCYGFYLGTQRGRQQLYQSDYSYEGLRKYAGSRDVNKEDASSVNQIVQLTGEKNNILREARGDIIVTAELVNERVIMTVNSFGMNRKIDLFEEEGNFYVNIYDGNDELTIPYSSLSQEYGGKTDICFPFYLYGARIANFISRMRHDYIDPKKYDMKNPNPFCIKDGSLQFDDDPSKFSGKDGLKRMGAELIGDDYIECLKDWESMGIDPSDEETKQKIVDFLNIIVNKTNG